jgi:hypothetical protein
MNNNFNLEYQKGIRYTDLWLKGNTLTININSIKEKHYGFLIKSSNSYPTNYITKLRIKENGSAVAFVQADKCYFPTHFFTQYFDCEGRQIQSANAKEIFNKINNQGKFTIINSILEIDRNSLDRQELNFLKAVEQEIVEKDNLTLSMLKAHQHLIPESEKLSEMWSLIKFKYKVYYDKTKQ